MRIICLLAPHLPVQVERQADPELAQRPLVVGGRPWDAGAVLDCCPQAGAAGVGPGMRLAQAEQLCPAARFVPAREEAYHAAHQALCAAAGRFTGRVESAALGQLFVEATGLERPFAQARDGRDGAERRLVAELVREASQRSGLEVQAGLAGGKFCAEQAARALEPGAVSVVPPGAERAFLSPLPISVLPAIAEMQPRLVLWGFFPNDFYGEWIIRRWLDAGEAAALESGGAGEVAGGQAAAISILTEEEFAWARQTYFERCAGCHGTLRKGATGPGLTPDLTVPKGTLGLAAIIFNGTNGGMPDWGKQGFFTQAETETMAKYLQIEPPTPPEFSMEQMKAGWKVLVEPKDRPTRPETTRDWQNYFIVTLRDAGQVAVIDGDTHEVVNLVDSGYAVHITRMSATGRYAYVIGRDGKLALIDLWMEKPDKVAEVQTCYDARSVEVSKYEGELGDFTDKYAIVGCYWPPHFAVLDGQTLEPFKVVSTRSYTYDTEEYHPEPRVASILASHYKPEWIVNIKETGQIWLVNYTDPINPTIKMIEAERFLHDGGLDSSKRYFMVAANNANRVAVVDLKEGKLEALVDTMAVPHPGRGANWVDPEFGPVWSTAHLGDPGVIAIGTDPAGHPDSAWKSVRDIPLPGAGSLFIKAHPDSPWIWVDMTLNPDPVVARTICVIAKESPAEPAKCWEAATYGRAVHFEFNRQGTEVWVSIWGDAKITGQTGEIVVYDAVTLEEITRIKDLVTPTGKFNVYNTVNDVY